MPTDRNKALVLRYLEEVHNQRRIEVLDEVMSPSFAVLSLQGRQELGLDAMREFITYRQRIIPDFHVTVDEVIAEGDKVVVRAHESGTPVEEYAFGDMFSFPATGKSFCVSWIDIYRIENDKIVDMWAEMDLMALKEQLG